MGFTFRGRPRGRSFAFRGRPFRGRGRGRGQFAYGGDERHRIRDERSRERRDFKPRPMSVDHGKSKSSPRREEPDLGYHERDLRDQLEEYNRPFKSRSNSPPRKRPHTSGMIDTDSEIHKRQDEELQKQMHSRQSPSPLRITVGNEIFYAEHNVRNRDSPFSEHRSPEETRERLAPLCERLGPPVNKDRRDDDNKDYSRRLDSRGGYRNRANSRDDNRYTYDSIESSNSLSDRYSERKHRSSRDKGDEIRQVYDIRGDRSSKERFSDRGIVRQDSSASYSGSRDRKNSRDKGWQGDHKKHYKVDRDPGRNRDRNARHSRSPSHERKDSNRQLVDKESAVPSISQKINYFHGKTPPSETDGQYFNPSAVHANMVESGRPDTPSSEHSPAHKSRPLKSILKKSGNVDASPARRQDQLDVANQFRAPESRHLQTLQDQPFSSLYDQTDIAVSRTDTLTHNTLTLNKKSGKKRERKRVLPGLVAYDMDVDDEEHFLYGEPEDISKSSSRPLFPVDSKSHSSQNTKTSEKSITTGTNLPFWAAAAPPDSALSAKLFALHEKIHGPKPNNKENDVEMRSSSESNHDKLFTHTVDDQNEEAKKEEDIDSTVQNILKSIGFDFELSKRMQELAKQKKEKEQKKPGEQHIGININQTASFLGGGMSSDVTENLFEKNSHMQPDTIKDEKTRGDISLTQSSRLQRSRESIAQEFQNREPNANKWHSSREKFDGPFLQQSQRQQINDDFDSVSESDYSSTDDHDSRSLDDKSRSPSSGHQSKMKHDRSQGHDGHQQHDSKSPNYGRSNDCDRSPYVEESWKSAPPAAEEWSNRTVRRDWQQEYPQQPITTQPYFDPHSIPPEYPHYYGHVVSPGQQPLYGPPPGYPLYPDMAVPPPGMYPPPGYPGFLGNPPGMFNYAPPFLSSQPDPQKEYHTQYKSESYSSNLTVIPLVEKTQQDTVDQKKKASLKSRALEKKGTKLRRETKSVKISKSDTKSITEKSVPTKKKETATESTRIVLPLKSEQKRKESSSSNRSSSVEPQRKRTKIDTEKDRPKTMRSQQLLSVKDRERLAKECEERKKKLDGLEREMAKLRKQQNEIMRKRRRQRDGHKDPLLAQNSKLQEEIAEQIKILRKAADESSDVLKSIKESPGSSMETHKENSSSKKGHRGSLAKEESPQLGRKEKKINYQYFDPGHHWCRLCNQMTLGIFEYLAHLQSKKHQQKFDPFERPWLESTLNDLNKKPPDGPSQACPIKGVEFMMSTAAFYCSLCREFSGDVTCANAHFKSDKHNSNYKSYVEKNPFYEKRMVLERTAYLSEKKEEDEKQKKQEILSEAVESVKQNIKKETLIADSDTNNSTGGFGKLNRKDEQKKISISENKAKEEKRTDDKKKEEEKSKEEKKKEEKPKEIKEEAVDSSKIAIKLTGKTGIKPPPKKVLPPWTPVTRKIPLKKSRGEIPVKKPIKPQDEDPPSLDTFLTVGPGSSDGKLPVVIVTNLESIPLPAAASLPPTPPPLDKHLTADAISGQLHSENSTKEKAEELKYLGIEMAEEMELKPKPPPPPSQNMSLPGDNMATSSAEAMYDIFYQNKEPATGNDVKIQELAVKENLAEESEITDVNVGQNASSSFLGNGNEEMLLQNEDTSSSDNLALIERLSSTGCVDSVQSDVTSVTDCYNEVILPKAILPEHISLEVPAEKVQIAECSNDQRINEILLPNKTMSQHPNSTDIENAENTVASEKDISLEICMPVDGQYTGTEDNDQVVHVSSNQEMVPKESVLEDSNYNHIVEDTGVAVCESNNENTLAQELNQPSVFEGSAVSSTTVSETVASTAISSVAESFCSIVQSSTDAQVSQVDVVVISPLVVIAQNVVNESEANNDATPILDDSVTSELKTSQLVESTDDDRCHLALGESSADTTSNDKGLMPAILNIAEVSLPFDVEHSGMETNSFPDHDDKIKADTTSNDRQFIGDAETTAMSHVENRMVIEPDEEANRFASGNGRNESKADTTSNVKSVFFPTHDNLATSEVDVQVLSSELDSSIVVDTEIGRNTVSTSNVCSETSYEHVVYTGTSVGEVDTIDANTVELETTVGTSSRSKSRTEMDSDKTDCTEAVGISLEPTVEAQDISEENVDTQDTSEVPNSYPVDNDESTTVQTQCDNGSNLAANPESVYVAVDEEVTSDVQSSTQTYFEDPFICSQTDSNKDMDIELSSASTCTSSTNNWTDVVSDAFAAIATLAESTSEVSIFSPSTSENFAFAASASEDSALAQSSSEILISDPAMSETFINPEAVQIEGNQLFEPAEVVDSTTHSNRDCTEFGKNEIVGTSSEIFGSNLVVVDSTEVNSDESDEVQIIEDAETEPGVEECDSMSESSEASLINMGSDFEVVDECQSD